MPTLVCLFGLLAAALFAIFAHASSDLPVAGHTSWIDLAFWAIVIASAAPLIVDWVRESFGSMRQRLGRKGPPHPSETESV